MSKQKSQKPPGKSNSNRGGKTPSKSSPSKKSKGAKKTNKPGKSSESPKKPKGTWHHHHHRKHGHHHHHRKRSRPPRGTSIVSKSKANQTTKNVVHSSQLKKELTKHKFVLKGRVPPLASDGILSPSRLQADEMTTIYAVPSGHFKTADDVVRFNDYEILEQIGKGGFAVVFKARNIKTGQMVACKTVKVGKWLVGKTIYGFMLIFFISLYR